MKKRLFVFIISLSILISLYVFNMESKPSPVDSTPMTPQPESNTKEMEEEVAEVQKDLLANTSYIDQEGYTIIKNPDDVLVLVNKNRNLPSDYVPEDLVIPDVRFSFEEYDEKKQLRKIAADALEDLFAKAEEEGFYLYAKSGYRSYARQKFLFDYRAERYGVEATNKLTAYPGQSEHQTGLAMDITLKSLNFELMNTFGQTEEGIWLSQNAHKFGFIIRYKEDAVDITGYDYEPWHIRYVGQDIAREIYERNITLEEYLGDESSIPAL